MLYYRNTEKTLDKDLFKNPSSEYRGAPFWAWNCALDREEVISQTHVFKEMGFGGYHAHVRSGLDTPYLGEIFNDCIRACAEEAKKEGMYLYLYDEDRWPSGYAGGMVTKNPRYSARFLRFTTKKSTDKVKLDVDEKLLEGKKLLGRYSVHAFGNKLISYRRLSDKDNPPGLIWYAYLETESPRSFLNNSPYVDTLNKEAIDLFAEITYTSYKKTVGEYFGRQIKSIFTDEPQFHRFKHSLIPLPFQSERRAWTDDFEETFIKEYGYSLLDKLPELFWEGNYFSEARYNYFNHLAERFACAYADNLSSRCIDMGIAFTGHLMEEPKLSSQTYSVGDCMRLYRSFHIPGIDILKGRHEFTTAKQAQSSLRQYGREGMLSELYGVSRWDSDFKNYKLIGDWQAALGVTLRVPHLSLMSMKGFAKRDYPASIFYQSPWYKKFKYLEDHFARLNTALTRGNAITEIAVIHPIESSWLLFGNSKTRVKCSKFDRKFSRITEILLRGGLDFDYISEATLPQLNTKGNYPLKVGEMQYKTVIVPNCITLRSSTLNRLIDFRNNGGKVIFVGDIPKYVDGKISKGPIDLATISERIPFQKKDIISSLEKNRLFGVYEKGKHTDNFVCQLREDGNGRWLFLANAKKQYNQDKYSQKRQPLTVKIKGKWKATIWNTINGQIIGVKTRSENSFTFLNIDMYEHDSLLLRFDNQEEKEYESLPIFPKHILSKKANNYSLSEPNVLILDKAYYALDGENYSRKKQELLYLDNLCRKRCGLPKRTGRSAQPWVLEKASAQHTIKLKFSFKSKIEIKDTYLALEDAEIAKIILNGTLVESNICGWYVDKAINKVRLPLIKKGLNVLEISLPFGLNTNIEWCYLLGSFAVSLGFSSATLKSLPQLLQYGDIGKQGFPFYGGELSYNLSFEGNGKPVSISVPKFKAALLEVKTSESLNIAFAPYTAIIPSEKGETKLNITAFISRQNAFGPVHLLNGKRAFTSPSSYYPPWRLRTKRYVLSKAGILSPPQIKLQ
jgi:hypothetical protein